MDRTRTAGQWVRWAWRWRQQPVAHGVDDVDAVVAARIAGRLPWSVVKESLVASDAAEPIEIQDFGAGSGPSGKTRLTTLGALESTASSDRRKAKWLWAFAQVQRAGRPDGPVDILELGTCLGAGAVSMVLGAGDRCRYVGLEGSPGLAALTKARLHRAAPGADVELRVGPFEETLPLLLASDRHFDLVFLDGHHEGPALLAQCAQLVPRLKPGAWVVVDDIRWSKGMHGAWCQLASVDGVIALDLFRMGALRVSRPEEGGSRGPKRVPLPLLA